MQIKIMVFGQLTDVINSSEITLNGNADTDSLLCELKKLYPALADAKYMIAVDKQTITENTILNDGSTIALLPPFSGG